MINRLALVLAAVVCLVAFVWAGGYQVGRHERPACVHTDGTAAARAQVWMDGNVPCREGR